MVQVNNLTSVAIAITAMFIMNIVNAQTDSILIMDNVNTFEEAIKPLHGKKIYIDMWATWCEPCIMEFRHKEELKKILDENDVQQLYISFDSDLYNERWKSSIKQYNLTGIHIRANEKLSLDILRLIYSTRGIVYETAADVELDIELSFPRYVLIDEEGNIINKRAARPSRLVAGEKLW